MAQYTRRNKRTQTSVSTQSWELSYLGGLRPQGSRGSQRTESYQSLGYLGDEKKLVPPVLRVPEGLRRLSPTSPHACWGPEKLGRASPEQTWGAERTESQHSPRYLGLENTETHQSSRYLRPKMTEFNQC